METSLLQASIVVRCARVRPTKSKAAFLRQAASTRQKTGRESPATEPRHCYSFHVLRGRRPRLRTATNCSTGGDSNGGGRRSVECCGWQPALSGEGRTPISKQYYIAAFQLRLMAPVCLTCGDKGNAALLIYCTRCRDSAVHQYVLPLKIHFLPYMVDQIRYCLNNVSPSDDNINWLCWDCAPKDCINEPSRKSERISSKGPKVRKTKKQRLEEDERLVHIRDVANETDKPATDHLPPVKDMEYLRELDFSEEKKLIFESPSCFKGQTESIDVNEPSLSTRSTCPIQEENITNSLDETRKIHQVKKKKRILILNDSESSKDDAKNIVFQAPSLATIDQVVSSQALSGQPFLKPEDSISAEPILDPKWRGWFNFKEDGEEDESCVEILAHASDKACSKVFDTTSAMPYTLDTQILQKSAVWPKSFRVTPPTAASIALFFFPANERDERVYDSLLDNVIQKELALKATIDNVELLIFSSYELPLPHRRFNGKYFFWGVFKNKKKHGSNSSSTGQQMESRVENSGCAGPVDGANGANKPADVLNYPNLQNLSPLSMDSSQASNLLQSKQNTPDSLHLSAAVERNARRSMFQSSNSGEMYRKIAKVVESRPSSISERVVSF
ncbi:succinyl-CoA ligase [ADP-forming] subunit beta [Striga asiatica]|uniref:Succinyl-CoA ligase [ADP-forming] subunit beta n=1 Tax=Striga asiatica TaxID=4170 RepID=A0A5A7Q393_STRAF|nr:succinyl-CoA ligase [ADP-forming] subunit beta [Striga asiatica]